MKGITLLLILPITSLAVILPFAFHPRATEKSEPNLRSVSRPRNPLTEHIRWENYLQSHPELSPYQASLRKLSSRLPLEKFAALSPALQARLAAFATSRLDPNIPAMTLCWAPGVAIEVMEAFHAVEEMGDDEPGETSAATQFDEGDRWGRNATFNSFFERARQGQPTTLRWSFMREGTSISGFNGEPTSDSELVSFLDGRYGVVAGGNDLTTRPWFSSFQAAFDNIASLTGITYLYEPNDDGADLTQSSSPSGRIGVRGDIRIGGHFIDGDSGSNTLAYNFFPNSGDMVIDTGNTSFYGNTSSDSINLRNVVEHEHGHGLGLSHVCPITETKLMEPFISRRFRGLQLDDIFSLNRLYGDFFEKQESSRNNDSVGNASELPVSAGEFYRREYLSIDDNSDDDFYRLKDIPTGTPITCKVIPISTPAGFTEGPQNSDGSCSAGASFNFTTIHDLEIALISPDGSTILARADRQPLGEAEEIIAFEAPATGDYFLRITGDSSNNTQLYTLEIDLAGAPETPSNFSVNITPASQVTLSWNDTSDQETGFQIERKLEASGEWSLYATIDANSESFEDANPATGTNLFYRVIALGQILNSAPSNEDTSMVVDLSAENYLFDFGEIDSPLTPGAIRISPLTSGDVSWSDPVASLDRGGADLSNRDYIFAATSRTWSHRLINGTWQVIVRQGDESAPRDDLTISAEGILQADDIDSAANQFVENT
ncbi:MAG: hypothetical protein ACJAVK_001338, partial [Akkermansiaceae bacterium]